MAEFIVKGPIAVPIKKQRLGGRRIDEDQLGKLEKEHATLREKGCYVFSLKASKGSKPLYVGKAAKQTIIREAFNPRNAGKLGRELNEQKGILQIWTITPDGKGRAPINEIKEIEKEMIEVASIKNPNLINIQNRSKKRNWLIQGVIQAKPGPRATAAKGFRKMVGIGD